MNLETFNIDRITQESPPEELSLPDRWIRVRLNQVIREVKKSLEDYKFNEAAYTLYQFIWHEFCDWYLELTKLCLYKEGDKRRQDLTRQTLLGSPRLHSPATSSLYAIYHRRDLAATSQRREIESIMVAEFPKPDKRFDDETVADEMGLIIEVINALRNIEVR
jgi:valyl-tRNA synthetase